MSKSSNPRRRFFSKTMALSALFSFTVSQLVFAEAILKDMTTDEKREKAVLIAREGDYTTALNIFENDLQVNAVNVSNNIVYDYMAVLNWDGQMQQVINIYESRYAANPAILPAFTKRIVGGPITV